MRLFFFFVKEEVLVIGTFHYIFQFLAHYAEEEHSIMRFYYVSYTTAVSFTMNKFFKVVGVKREAAVILYVDCM